MTTTPTFSPLVRSDGVYSSSADAATLGNFAAAVVVTGMFAYLGLGLGWCVLALLAMCGVLLMLLARRITARVVMVLGSAAALLVAGGSGLSLGGWVSAIPAGATAAALSVLGYQRMSKWLLSAGDDWY